eukprot:g307.t1
MAQSRRTGGNAARSIPVIDLTLSDIMLERQQCLESDAIMAQELQNKFDAEWRLHVEEATSDVGLFDVLRSHRERIRDFLQENWKADKAVKVKDIQENPHSLPGQPLYNRFVEAWQRVADQTVQCVFHGTPEKNISQICRDGLDPKRRSGQAYGPGEYFSRTATIPLGYVKGGRKLIVFAVLMDNSGLTENLKNLVVINKPEHQLPLFVVSFQTRKGTSMQKLNDAAMKELDETSRAATSRRSRPSTIPRARGYAPNFIIPPRPKKKKKTTRKKKKTKKKKRATGNT